MARAGRETERPRAVRLNAAETAARTFHSPLPPERVIAELARAAKGSTGPAGQPVFTQRLVDGRAVLSYRDPRGEPVTVVAQAAADGGTRYVVTRGAPGQWAVTHGQDTPGRDVPDVPRPPDSWRAFCLENPSGSGRFMLSYQGYNAAEATGRFYRRRMPELGWTLDRKLSQRLSDVEVDANVQLAGDYLAFRKGARTCLVSMSYRPGNVIATTILVR